MGLFVKFADALLAMVLGLCLPGLVQATHEWMLDDFDASQLVTTVGRSWIVIADDLMGAATEARIEAVPAGAGGGRALRLSAELATPRSFAGAWAPLDAGGRSVDLTGFAGIRLRVRGGGPLDVGLRAGLLNVMAEVEAGPEWRTVDVPFSRLLPRAPSPPGAAWSLASVQVLGVTTRQGPLASGSAGGPRHVEFAIDDVRFYGAAARAQSPVPVGPPTGMTRVPFTAAAAVPVHGWEQAAIDPAGDSIGALPDAVRLEFVRRDADDRLWVRVHLAAPPTGRWMGVNLALDVDGDPANGMAWWGANTAFKFDRLVSAWCFRVADGCQGFIGVADAAQVGAGVMAGPGGEALKVAITTHPDAFVVAVPRRLLGLTGRDARVVAAVGSALLYADDVPGSGAAIVR